MDESSVIFNEKYDQSEVRDNYIQKSVEMNPRSARIHRVACQFKTFTSAEDPQFQQMNALCNSNGTNEEDKTMLHFALAKAYDDIASYDQAFEHYRMGNSLKRRQVQYDSQEITTRVGVCVNEPEVLRS